MAFVFLQNVCSQAPFAEQQCLKLGKGVNIIGYDHALWKNHTNGRFKEPYFRMIKEAGFSNVRVNLHPFSNMNKDYSLKKEYLETLDWVVKNGLEAGLMVILDLHEFNAMADDPEAKKEMFLSVWRQLAPRYKEASDNLLFEILNEPNRKLSAELWNIYLREALEIIRQTNPGRTVIIGPANWNGIESLPGLSLPDNDRNIIVTVHFYHPMNFTHQGAPWAKDFVNLKNVRWTGTQEEKNEIESKLRMAKDWSSANKRPIYLGEFGAYDKADMESRALYTGFVARTCEKLGFSWAYWQFDSDFILYDIEKEEWVKPLLDALVNP